MEIRSDDQLAPMTYSIQLIAPAVGGTATDVDLARNRCVEASGFVEMEGGSTVYKILVSGTRLEESAQPTIDVPELELRVMDSPPLPQILFPVTPLPNLVR